MDSVRSDRGEPACYVEIAIWAATADFGGVEAAAEYAEQRAQLVPAFVVLESKLQDEFDAAPDGDMRRLLWSTLQRARRRCTTVDAYPGGGGFGSQSAQGLLAEWAQSRHILGQQGRVL